MTLLLGTHLLVIAYLDDAHCVRPAPLYVDASFSACGRTGEWVKSQRALALSNAPGPSRTAQDKGPQAPLKKQGTRSAKDDSDDIAKMAIDDRPLAKSLSKKTSRLEVVKVHHSSRPPPFPSPELASRDRRRGLPNSYVPLCGLLLVACWGADEARQQQRHDGDGRWRLPRRGRRSCIGGPG